MRTQPKREIIGKSGMHYGTMGHKTKGVYADGSAMHVGDLVAIYWNGRYASDSLVVKDKGGSAYIMGLADIGDKYKNGAYYDFSISLIKKYYNVADGMYRSGLLKVVTLENDPHLVSKSKKVTEQKSKLSQIIVPVKADLLFDKPVVEESRGETFIATGRTTIYMNTDLGVWGMSTCHPDDIKTYDKEIGKALAYYRAYSKEA